MPIPVSVSLDRGGQGQLDLSPLVASNSLTWSSVVPGGFASCSFQLDGDPRQLVKQVPYLSILRVIGDSGRVLFEGQIEDLAATISETSTGLKVGAYGLQNVLGETTLRRTFMKRDLSWGTNLIPVGFTSVGITADAALSVATGQFDPTDLTTSGVQVTPNTGSLANNHGAFAQYLLPTNLIGLTQWIGVYNLAGTDSGTTRFHLVWQKNSSAAWSNVTSTTTPGTFQFVLGLPSSVAALRVGVVNNFGSAIIPAATDVGQFYDMRVLGVVATEDTYGGLYGDTLLNSILGFQSTLGAGVIEPGTDFLIDHLDASETRSLIDLVNEVAGYYRREWAVWEDALFHWTTPNLAQHEWIVPIQTLSSLDLDASVTNSRRTVLISFLDAASGTQNTTSAASTDRRNPYVLNGRIKHLLLNAGFPMTTTTATQLANKLIQDIGYGPVPAAGTISLSGETIVQHAQGNAAKAWELRAGDNVTIPELPLADVFTQDGRGECLFHIVSAESNISSGNVTLSLDSYGSKRSDVLLARLAAVTNALGG